MKLIIGIGNPGGLYSNTRHNIGFRLLDKFCQIHNLEFQPSKGDFWFVESKIKTFHFFLAKPTTFVNNSGLAIKEILDDLKIPLDNLLVVCDDTNLSVGDIRIRKSGSDGGHNGLKSIIYHLENENFTRLRIGVGIPRSNLDLADYVLAQFPDDEFKCIEQKFELIINLIEQFIFGGSDQMLNHFSKQTNNFSKKVN